MKKLLRRCKNAIADRAIRRRFGHEEFRRIRFVWGDVWKDWYAQHASEAAGQLQLLKSGMDAESCAHVDNIFERYVFITPRQRYGDYFLCDVRRMFTEAEREAQLRVNAEFVIEGIKKRFPLPIDYYPPAIFHFGDGLAYLRPEDLARIRDADVIDGGAWIGDSALAFTAAQPARIFCFEPIERNYKYLLETIQLNPGHKLIPVRKGLGERDQRLELFGDLTDASINPEVLKVNTEIERQQRESIEITSIDKFVSDLDARPGLIKLDIESAEMDALHGAAETICRFRPILIISIYHTPREFFGAKPFLEHLDLGYRFAVRRLDVFHPTTETVLIAMP